MMKCFRASALSLLVCAAALAQNAALMPDPKMQFLDATGAPLAGGMLYTCVASAACAPSYAGDPALTPLATYTDTTASVANANPIILDSAGRASVWLGSGSYKIVLQDATGATVWTQDNVTSIQALKLNGSTFLNYTAPGSSTVRTVAAKLGESVSVSDFGATGNGTTDDSAAIQAAITAVSGSGGTVLVPVGTYKIVSTIQMKPGVRLVGNTNGVFSGAGGAVLKAGTASMTMVEFHSASRAGLQNLHLDANSLATITAIKLDTYPDVSIALRDLYIDGTPFYGVQGSDTYFVSADNVRVQNIAQNGIAFYLSANSNSWTLNNCSAIYTGATGQAYSVWQNNGGPVTIMNSTFEGAMEMKFYQSTGAAVIGNYFEDAGLGTQLDHWITLGLSSSIPPTWNNFAYGATIQGNLFAGGANYAVLLGSVNGVEISGNHVATALGAWRWYNFDNAYKKGIHIGTNSYISGADPASWYPANVVSYWGSQPGTTDSILTTTVDEHFQPQLLNAGVAPQASHMNADSAALYYDSSLHMLMVKKKAADGTTITTQSLTGTNGSTLYPDAANSPYSYLAYINPAGGVDGGQVTGYGGVQIKKLQSGGLVLAQFGGYNAATPAYFGAIGFGPNNTTPSPGSTVHVLDARASTGSTNVILQAGAGQGSAHILDIDNNAGTSQFSVDASGNTLIPSIKSTTGQRYVCVDTTGKLVSSASACSGT